MTTNSLYEEDKRCLRTSDSTDIISQDKHYAIVTSSQMEIRMREIPLRIPYHLNSNSERIPYHLNSNSENSENNLEVRIDMNGGREIFLLESPLSIQKKKSL